MRPPPDSAAASPAVALRGVQATYLERGLRVEALHDVNLTVARGEFVSVIGPSGCGKSTMLNLIAGIDRPSGGEIAVDGRSAIGRTGLVAHMPQRDLLLPWRTTLQNAVLGPELRGEPDREAQALAQLDRFGLEGFADAYPHMLSGGMRQRAAMLRTILLDRDTLLLDEPFGALDALTRGEMQEWLLGIWTELAKTVLFVTHDVEEAIFLSDRVYVMTRRPGTMKLELAIDLPRPREREMTTSAPFVDAKRMLLHALLAETQR
ncbi:MAG: ABC transporter ATP-binding protein [Chloroflexi bacterium]|nr:ABC transporter ATP-binding protein [Chloroflexota bacterium]